ncbi:unnamed protein product [Vitrella brassicaformis CCMP3155]|uniref:BTB domain-containing protein n=2 Tax=Vitrella brassicaformis TaxID=1169539 RepID=A0A0G4EY57_VITBC|nr:unnamed protein product [Vitrella brassicaformis CCMP3155]|mmetsp:Transcript_3/g.12  ORF Transcript_3/g.12 Transcript_3/m.12 type:complete len:581 (+) Transcript_3:24-1766(+)|eukprot:CEM04055.1 unnamed protein product [Vitrella brassicaformis CCMP3155]
MTGVEREITLRFGGEQPPLVIKESVAKQYRYFTQVLSGAFREGQQQEMRIDSIDRSVALEVLQPDGDIAPAMTKDNFVRDLVAIDYLQPLWVTDGNARSLLGQIKRRVVAAGWLADSSVARALLDSFGSCPLIARLIHGFKDIQARLVAALMADPSVLREQWKASVKGQEGEAIKAAIALTEAVGDAISAGNMSASKEQLGLFLQIGTGASSATEAIARVKQHEVFVSTSTSQHALAVPQPTPSAGNVWFPLDDGRLAVGAYGIPRIAPIPPLAPIAAGVAAPARNRVIDPPVEIRVEAPGGGVTATTNVTDIKDWGVFVRLSSRLCTEGGTAACFSLDWSVEASNAQGSPVPLHAAPTVSRECVKDEVKYFGVALLGASPFLCYVEPNLPADTLREKGVGDARCSDVKVNLAITTYPMRVMALHYLRKCIKDSHWDEVATIASSLDRAVAMVLMAHWSRMPVRRQLLLMAHWWKGINVNGPTGGFNAADAALLGNAVRRHMADVPAFLRTLGHLLSHEDRNKVFDALDCHLWRAALSSLMDTVSTQQKEIESLSSQVATLKLQLDECRGSSSDKRVTPN